MGKLEPVARGGPPTSAATSSELVPGESVATRRTDFAVMKDLDLGYRSTSSMRTSTSPNVASRRTRRAAARCRTGGDKWRPPETT